MAWALWVWSLARCFCSTARSWLRPCPLTLQWSLSEGKLYACYNPEKPVMRQVLGHLRDVPPQDEDTHPAARTQDYQGAEMGARCTIRRGCRNRGRHRVARHAPMARLQAVQAGRQRKSVAATVTVRPQTWPRW